MPIYLQLVAFLDDIDPEHPIRLLLLKVAHILRDVNDLDLRHLHAHPPNWPIPKSSAHHPQHQPTSQPANPTARTKPEPEQKSTFLEGGSACCFLATCAEISRAIRSHTWHRM